MSYEFERYLRELRERKVALGYCPVCEERREREEIITHRLCRSWFRLTSHLKGVAWRVRRAIPQARLRRLHRKLNQRYWNGRLTYRVELVTPLGMLSAMYQDTYWLDMDEDTAPLGRCEHRDECLYISVRVPAKEIRGTLLHEMIHEATLSGHDAAFMTERSRLIDLGEWTPVEERNDAQTIAGA